MSATERGGVARLSQSLSHAAAFWVIAGAFAVTMSFTTVPTTMWSLYEQHAGYSTLMVTVAFTSYSFGVLGSLIFLGHVSDWWGRRPLLVGAVLCQLLAAVALISSRGFVVVVLARLISGIGVGMITATATAHMAELFRHAAGGASERAAVIATAANLGGLGLGPLLGGMMTQYLPSPLRLPYVIYLLLLVLALIAVLSAPETVARERRRYRPQRPQVATQDRFAYLTAALSGTTLFAILGIFTSLAPQVLHSQGVSSRMLEGTVAAAVLLSSGGTQLLLRRAPDLQLRKGGLVAVAVGALLLLSGALFDSAPLFIAGGVIGGGGGGALFRGALVQSAALSPPHARGETAAGVFVGAYVGMAIPVLGIGFLTAAGVSLSAALSVFVVLVLALAAWVRLAIAIGERRVASRG